MSLIAINAYLKTNKLIINLLLKMDFPIKVSQLKSTSE
jgi:hypothetical protein